LSGCRLRNGTWSRSQMNAPGAATDFTSPEIGSKAAL
jgi:hypothetical protein